MFDASDSIERSRRRRSLVRSARPVVAFAFIGATAGMLIWSKLRLVSGLPRSAYAVPEAVAGGEPQPDHGALEPAAQSPDTDIARDSAGE